MFRKEIQIRTMVILILTIIIINILYYIFTNIFSIFSETPTQPDNVENSNQPPRPCKCDFPNCSKAFKNSSALNQHKKKHMNQITVSCKICSKNYPDKGLLIQHLNHYISKFGTSKPRGEHGADELRDLIKYKKELQNGQEQIQELNKENEGTKINKKWIEI